MDDSSMQSISYPRNLERVSQDKRARTLQAVMFQCEL